MVARGFGRIVNVGSVTAVMAPGADRLRRGQGRPDRPDPSVARAVARNGITVNCVTPASIDTDLPQTLRYTDRDRLTELIPAGRWGRPRKWPTRWCFLLQDQASYITGAVLTVAAG